jgi:hypothetical protein
MQHNATKKGTGKCDHDHKTPECDTDHILTTNKQRSPVTIKAPSVTLQTRQYK